MQSSVPVRPVRLARCAHSLLDSPASQTSTQRSFADAQSSSPNAYAESFASPGYERVFTHVLNLLLLGSPSTVGWFVVPVVVDAVQTVSRRWPWTHVRKKALKAHHPRRTDGDATSPVVFVGGISGVEAALSHRCPGAVLGCARILSRHRDHSGDGPGRLPSCQGALLSGVYHEPYPG